MKLILVVPKDRSSIFKPHIDLEVFTETVFGKISAKTTSDSKHLWGKKRYYFVTWHWKLLKP
jgi:hypothetical protein